jgi:hypothetical protein
MLGAVGIEVGSRLGARKPVSELDPEVLSTPDCATARHRAGSALVRVRHRDLRNNSKKTFDFVQRQKQF